MADILDFDVVTLDHDWVRKYRIPMVASEYPRWYYEVCLVVPTEDQHPGGLTFLWPTEDEAEMIGRAIEHRMLWYREGWRNKMREQPLDVDGTTNTLILAKTNEGWQYRRRTWEHGLSPKTSLTGFWAKDKRPFFPPNMDGLKTLLDRELRWEPSPT